MNSKFIAFLIGSSTGLATFSVQPGIPGPLDREPSEDQAIQLGCAVSKCDVRRREATQACAKCMIDCVDHRAGCDSTQDCPSVCSELACTQAEETECEQHEYSVHLKLRKDRRVETACHRFARHLQACGDKGTVEEARCEWASTIERSEMASVYDCAARRKCGVSGTDCLPKGTDFGSELCMALFDRCQRDCSDDQRRFLDDAASRLRTDILAVARKCAQQASCDLSLECLEAWRASVAGPP